MKRFLRSFADIRRGEIGISMLMLANIIAIMVTYYFLKPARDSLFLTKVDVERLPWVFILTALVSAPVVSMYSRAGRRLKLHQLINATLLLIIGFLVFFYFFIKLPYPWVPYAFYVWVSIYGALTTSQVWLLANGVFTASQAKRIFPVLGLGAIVGAWLGGELTSLLLHQFKQLDLGLENLLLFCAGFLLVSILLTNIVHGRRRAELEEQSRPSRDSERRESMLDLYREIARSRHLLLMVGIISIAMIVASIVDWQFKAIAKMSFDSPQELGAFFGTFYGRLSLVSLLLQLFFSYGILRRLGVGGIILFLPVGLLIGSTAMLLSAGLTAAVMLRGADGSLRYSLDKTGRELLFLPIPLDVKKKTKVFIDVLVDRWFRGVAGALLLFLIWLFGFKGADPATEMWKFSLVVAGLLVVWIGMSLLMRREYVNTFRSALQRRAIDPGEIRINIAEASTMRALLSSLSSHNDREISYALDMLASVRDKSLVQHVLPLVQHRDAEVRFRALKVLQLNGDASLIVPIKPAIVDSDPLVRREAFHILYLFDRDRQGLVRDYLGHEDPHLQCTALTCVAEYGTAGEKELITPGLIGSLLAREREPVEIRLQVARSLGALGHMRFRGYVQQLLGDESPAVRCEALAAVGRMRDRELVSHLIGQLAVQPMRATARAALVNYGSAILGTLYDYLVDPTVDFAVRRHIPRVIAGISEQESVDGLTAAMRKVGPRMKYYVVKGLNHLRVKSPHLAFDTRAVDDALLDETRSYYEILQVLRCNDGEPDTPASALLKRALVEKQDANLERIFRLLGLEYPPNDIYSAYLGIVSRKKALRASAVEFLDNLLRTDLKRMLLPIVDEDSVDSIIRRGREVTGTVITTRDEAMEYLIEGQDTWLRACAIYAAGPNVAQPVQDKINAACDDTDPVVKQTALLVSRQ
ncbi:MAG: Npt1/Npt2 family nucleotide transporter [candidate division Zixibacteria bacterium]|nr:Npt1/Npt2 family nucleotide transporter [candidate division Zixibacteria bacterium]